MTSESPRKGAHRARLASFEVEVTAIGLDELQQAGILRAVKSLFDSQHTVWSAEHREIVVNAVAVNAAALVLA